jgi:hypothetical protein
MSALTRSHFDPYLIGGNDLPASSLRINRVTAKIDDGWLLNDERIAQCATSCLIEPNVGDQVLVVQDDSQHYILSILVRQQETKDATLIVPNANKVTVQCEELAMQCRTGITFQSAGKIVLQSKHFIQEVKQNIVQVFRGFIAKGEQWDVSTTVLNRTHSRHQIMTAEKEIKVDADRINMG